METNQLVLMALRAAIAMIFVWSAIDQLSHPQPLSNVLRTRGYNILPGLVRVCGLFELIGACLLVYPQTSWIAGVGLGLFVFLANLMVNNFWSLDGMDKVHAKQKIMAGLGMSAGLFYVAAVNCPYL